MKRIAKCNRDIDYHHIRNMIVLIGFTVLMATLTCLFAYLFDQIFGIDKHMGLNHAHRSIRLLTIQRSRFVS